LHYSSNRTTGKKNPFFSILFGISILLRSQAHAQIASLLLQYFRIGFKVDTSCKICQ